MTPKWKKLEPSKSVQFRVRLTSPIYVPVKIADTGDEVEIVVIATEKEYEVELRIGDFVMQFGAVPVAPEVEEETRQ